MATRTVSNPVVVVTGYPSDGIMQVEEEEEAQQDSEADTYTVEEDYELRQRYPINFKTGRSHRPHTHQLKEAGNPAGILGLVETINGTEAWCRACRDYHFD